MKRRAVVGAIVIAGLAIGILVALVGWAPGGHQPSGAEWIVQTLLIGAVIWIVASRVRRKG